MLRTGFYYYITYIFIHFCIKFVTSLITKRTNIIHSFQIIKSQIHQKRAIINRQIESSVSQISDHLKVQQRLRYRGPHPGRQIGRHRKQQLSSQSASLTKQLQHIDASAISQQFAQSPQALLDSGCCRYLNINITNFSMCQ